MASKTQLKVAIVGSGTMGTALAHVIASAGHESTLISHDITIVDSINNDHRHPLFFRNLNLHPAVKASTDFTSYLPSADLLVMAVPSYEMRATAKQIQPFTAPRQSVLSVTKGFEPLTYNLMSDVLSEELSCLHIGTLSGPNITLDLVKNQPTMLMVSSTSEQMRTQGQLALSLPHLTVALSDDIKSYEYISALKNIAAIEVGIVTGFGLGDNFRALVLAQGMSEISHLLTAMGLKSPAFYGLAGLSDIFLTCCSPVARNYTIGVDLGRGALLTDLVVELQEKGEVAEGIESVKAGYQLAQQFNCQLPLLEITYNFMYQNKKSIINEDFITAVLQNSQVL